MQSTQQHKEVPMPHPLDEIAPVLAKWLAPYVAEELGVPGPSASPELSADYDEETCQVYLSEIGDPVLYRAEVFFMAITEKAHTGEAGLDSLELAELLDGFERQQGRGGVGSPRQIAALLTNSLKRRAKALGLPRPWEEGVTRGDRTLWIDRDGIADRMVPAIFDEQHRRYPHPADDVGGPRDLEARRRLARGEA
jgi:hypothetical protein